MGTAQVTPCWVLVWMAVYIGLTTSETGTMVLSMFIVWLVEQCTGLGVIS